MFREQQAFSLSCRDEDQAPPVLVGVQAVGRLDGVLFELTLRQTYRNAGRKNLEVIYTFPLHDQAVLLGFASELNGARKVGTITSKREAEREYEVALAQGDAPVMLEASGGGIHTANVGNLQPGDEMVLEVRFAQCLMFEQGRIRLAIPGTIAPRYGNPADSGLQPQQEPTASLFAEYPLALSITVAGSLASGALDCPTHRFTRSAVEGGLQLDLAEGAWLDRDVVILLKPVEPSPSLVIQAQDSVANAAPVVVMAAFQPQASAPRGPIALKLLVDCSGSMGGDSIASARVALTGVAQRLGEGDHVSLTCFGSTFEQRLKPTACTPKTLSQLGSLIDGIDADLGGTEMHLALASVFKLSAARGMGNADVLLLTDGEIWKVEETIEAAKKSGHRIFVIGVGSAPAHSVVRSLAEETGGACEFATPGEALEAAAARMIFRMRQPLWREARIDWGSQPQWQTAVPLSVFGGDTVIAFAGLSANAQTAAVQLTALNDQGEQTTLARGEASAVCPGDTLPRMAAAERIKTLGDKGSLPLALAYQLMGPQTNCILVHQRAEADKPQEAAELHRVQAMLAAGWGATSSVDDHEAVLSCSMGMSLSAMSSGDSATDTTDFRAMKSPAVWRTRSSPAAPSRMAPKSGIKFGIQMSSSDDGQTIVSSAKTATKSLRVIAQTVADHLGGGGDVQGLNARCAALVLRPDEREALDEVIASGIDQAQAWVLLAQWVNAHTGTDDPAAINSALQAALATIDPQVVSAANAIFDDKLGSLGHSGQRSSRFRRLLDAMAGI
jgi:Ca-activated chloride channel family protein